MAQAIEDIDKQQLTGPGAEDRMVIAEENTLTIRLHNKQVYYMILDLLEAQDQDFIVVER
jgi:hypothetical protein